MFSIPALDEVLGAKVLLKAETEQVTGSFKYRGALNMLLSLSPEEQRNGVVAASSGNHGAAVALLARDLHIPAVLVVPVDAPRVKVAAIREHGAEIRFYQPGHDDRDAITATIADDRGMKILPSSNDPSIVAGNGTVALELLEEAGDLDRLLVPVGGGGLAAGCATVAKALQPSIEVFGVEPTGADDTAISLHEHRHASIRPPRTIADGLRHETPGAFTLAINRRLLDDIDTVSDAQVAQAMAMLWRHGNVVCEPSGACALADVLAHRDRLVPPNGREGPARIGVVLSGGNVDSDRFRELTAPYLGEQAQSRLPEIAARRSCRPVAFSV